MSPAAAADAAASAPSLARATADPLAAGAASELPSPVAPRAFDAAGNRVVWLLRRDLALDAAAARASLAASPDPSAEILALLAPGPSALQAWFYNPDGSPEVLCGNALRCLAAFLGLPRDMSREVTTALGPVTIWTDARGWGWAALPLAALTVGPCDAARPHPVNTLLIDVGTPHLVEAVDDVNAPELTRRGLAASTGESPLNATFFSWAGAGDLRVRTLERGVASETRSCGTGAIAAFLAARALASLPGVAPASPVAPAPTRVRARFPSGEELVVMLSDDGARVAVGGRVGYR